MIAGDLNTNTSNLIYTAGDPTLVNACISALCTSSGLKIDNKYYSALLDFTSDSDASDVVIFVFDVSTLITASRVVNLDHSIIHPILR